MTMSPERAKLFRTTYSPGNSAALRSCRLWRQPPDYCADMRDSGPPHLAESPAPRRRWWLWAGAGVATVLLVATVAWVTTPDQPRRAANQSAAGLSAAPSTTAGAVATTLNQAP